MPHPTVSRNDRTGEPLDSKAKFLALQSAHWTTNSNLRRYDHPVVVCFSDQRIAYLRESIDFSDIDNALEVGAGDGFATRAMDAAVPNLVVSDLSLPLLRINPASRGQVAQSLAEDLPFRDESFDLVYCWEVLHHVSDISRAIREMARVSKRYLVFFEPNRNNPLQLAFSALLKTERQGLKFSPGFLRSHCDATGLRILRLDAVGCIFPNRTPAWMFPFLRRRRFIRPLTGISLAVVAEKRNVSPARGAR